MDVELYNKILALFNKKSVSFQDFKSFEFFIYNKYSKLERKEISIVLSQIKNKFIKPLPEYRIKINQEKERTKRIAEQKKDKIEKPSGKVYQKKVQSQKNQSYRGIQKTFRVENKMKIDEAELLKLRRKYVNTNYTILKLCEELYWFPASLVLVLKTKGLSQVSLNSLVDMEIIKMLKDEIYSRMLEINDYETEIVTKIKKVRPNYVKLIYTPTGNKR